MTIRLTFLGTSCSTPVPHRNLSSLALTYRGEWFLFDTPEGVQQQLMRGGLSYLKLGHVFISHFHGDHTLGLPGLLATMTIHERQEKLHIWGPRGIQKKIQEAVALGNFFPSFPIVPHEVLEGELVREKDYTISAVRLDHSCPCYGFLFETKGKEGEFQRAKALKLGIPEGPLWGKLQKGENVMVGRKTITPKEVMDYSKGMRGAKVGFIMDTFPHPHYVHVLKEWGVDYLVHESSFLETEKERAEEVRHSTARMAGRVAKETGTKRLFLTHFSPRYPDEKEMVKEATKVFQDVTAAHDLMEVELEDRFPVKAVRKQGKKK
ncbi:MAG: ribonuclease Z [Candidatus Diapherotrites archaeon]|nr:ribonuclease Z [Candidatus Diapherotrites archaeon]MDZ4256487.1 ribonuclease Z [archaeon]